MDEELRKLFEEMIRGSVSGMRDEIAGEMRETRGTGNLATITGAQTQVRERSKGEGAARIIRALAAGKGDPERAARFVRSKWEDDDVAKALESGADEAGGFIIPPGYVNELIELLYPMAVMRQMGCTTMPMNNGTLEIPKLTGGVAAEYVGESQNITVDQPTFGTLNLAWKKLAVIVPISNDLVRDSSPNADTVVRDDAVTAMALREDRAFIRDDGTGQRPTGMRFQEGITVLVATDVNALAGSDAKIQAVRNDLSALELALEDSNVRMIRPGYIISPRTFHFLANLTDGNGNAVFRAELNQGRLNGYPVRRSNQLPNNLSFSRDEGATQLPNGSEIYFADFADCIIGESTSLIVDASGEAAYHDGTALQAAFSRDQTVIRLLARHDFGLRHEEAVAVLEGVDWGQAA